MNGCSGGSLMSLELTALLSVCMCMSSCVCVRGACMYMYNYTQNYIHNCLVVCLTLLASFFLLHFSLTYIII